MRNRLSYPSLLAGECFCLCFLGRSRTKRHVERYAHLQGSYACVWIFILVQFASVLILNAGSMMYVLSFEAHLLQEYFSVSAKHHDLSTSFIELQLFSTAIMTSLCF